VPIEVRGAAKARSTPDRAIVASSRVTGETKRPLHLSSMKRA
jgi:hypothetical protein